MPVLSAEPTSVSISAMCNVIGTKNVLPTSRQGTFIGLVIICFERTVVDVITAMDRGSEGPTVNPGTVMNRLEGEWDCSKRRLDRLLLMIW